MIINVFTKIRYITIDGNRHFGQKNSMEIGILVKKNRWISAFGQKK